MMNFYDWLIKTRKDLDVTEDEVSTEDLRKYYDKLVREEADYYAEMDEERLREDDYTEITATEREFLVQRVSDVGSDDEYRSSSIMTASELIHYIDMQDICYEKYDIFEITEFGKFVHLHYVGWQPDCLIEFANDNGEVVLSGYGTDH